MLADPKVLAGLGLNQREVRFLADRPFWDLASLYYQPYLDSFSNEYRPFDAGLNALDTLSTTELFKKDGASAGALGFIGGQGSALQAVWHAAILKLRGVPLWPPKVYRLVGGNQTLTDTFAARLGDRLRLESPVTRIEHGRSGVRVSYRERGETRRLEADYLVSAISAVMLRAIPVSPAWPATKAFALGNVPYYFDSRVIFQTRSKFWAKDGISPNMEINEDALQHVWSTCDEVAVGTGPARRHGHRGGFPRCGAGLVSQALHRPVRGHRESPGPCLDQEPVGIGLRDHRVSGRIARQILAGTVRAGRPRALRGRLRRQSELGHGSRDPVGQSRRRGHRARVLRRPGAAPGNTPIRRSDEKVRR